MKQPLITMTALYWILTMASVKTAVAQVMPQDNWVHVASWGPAGTGSGQLTSYMLGIATDTNDLVYVTESTPRVSVFTANGTFVRSWGTYGTGDGNFNNQPSGIAVGPDGLIYISDVGALSNPSRIQVFTPQGAFVRKWGSRGLGDGQFAASVMYLAIGANGLVYAAEQNRQRIQVFDAYGNFQRKWGAAGSGPGQFSSSICGIAIAPDGLVCVAEDGVNARLQFFLPDGTFVRQVSVSTQGGAISIARDGVICTGYALLGNTNILHNSLYNLGVVGPMCFGSDDRLFCRANDGGKNQIAVLARTYRTVPPTSSVVPCPYIISSSQRAGKPWIDVKYVVWDSARTNVQTAALGFISAGNSLSNVARISTLLEGTATNLGPSIRANTTNNLTWNVAADWAVDVGNVAVEMLAKDERGLLGFHFITIPSNGPSPQLTIDRSPVTSDDLLSCWYWLIATSDPAITLSTGSVVGVGGAFNGQLLASGTNTTSAGRSFLFSRLGVREATTSEVVRARAGTTGLNSQWTPRYTIGPGDRPKAVNEVGFDTGNWGTNAWFVVPAP